MKKITAIILILCMLASLLACSKKKEPATNTTPESGEQNQAPQDTVPTVVVPEYKDYGRGTLNFEALYYLRPDITSAITSFDSVTLSVSENTKSPEEIIAEIRSLESTLDSIKSMCALVEINYAKDSSSDKWKNEHGYIGIYYPLLSQAVEGLLVACAKSEHRETFERDYFGYSLEEYLDGGIYTDEVVALMQREAELEDEYSSLDTSTVHITYKRTGTDKVFEGTVDEVKEMLREYFANDEAGYKAILILVDELYRQKLNELTAPIYVELVKTRRLIANELGYESYSELAYEAMGYDYSPEDMLKLLGDIGRYVAPVANELDSSVFYSYFTTNYQPTLNRVSLINDLYEVYSEMGGDYADAYSYMLQHGLYDVSEKQDNRFEGAFSTYIDKNASPYVFMTTSGFIRDYTTLSHEFGHFLDGYLNYGQEDSLAIMEVSSQALELLTLLKIKGHIYTPEYKYLEYYTVSNILKSVIMTQGFFAAFEHMVYALEYDEITKEKLEELVDEAAVTVYGDMVLHNYSLSDVTITHTMLYPFYVESYVTSAFVSLDIFFAESSKTGKTGDGLALYEALIKRETVGLSFLERLNEAGLESPFADLKARSVANYLYYYITGKSYYNTDESSLNAA